MIMTYEEINAKLIETRQRMEDIEAEIDCLNLENPECLSKLDSLYEEHATLELETHDLYAKCQLASYREKLGNE